jgi:hypothetical protein
MKYFFPVLLLVSLCTGVFASGQTDRSGVKGLDEGKIGQMEKIIRDRYHWEPGDYTLEYRAEWDQTRLPHIIAVHKTKKIDWSPHFFILPDKSLVTPGDPDGFMKVFLNVFTPINGKDAHMLAELALYFGLFGSPVGHLWTGPVDNKMKNGPIPRKDPEPVIELSSGGSAVLKFYSYDYELMVLHDCTVEFQGAKYTAASKRLD